MSHDKIFLPFGPVKPGSPASPLFPGAPTVPSSPSGPCSPNIRQYSYISPRTTKYILENVKLRILIYLCPFELQVSFYVTKH